MKQKSTHLSNSYRRYAAQISLLFLVSVSTAAFAGHWTHWRGPYYNGSAGEQKISTSLNNIKWKTALPGSGASTPVTIGNSIFLTCELPGDRQLMAVCIDRKDGRVRWMKSGGKAVKVPQSNMATPSAVTDGERVFFMFGNGEFAAFDFDGKELWRRNIEKEYGKLTTRFGYSSSPLLYKDKLYVVVMRLDTKHPEPTDKNPATASYFMAIDPETGENIWKHSRPNDGRDESQEAYTSPIPYEYGGRSEVLILGGDCLTGHDPETGEELWRWKGYNPKRITVGRIISSLVVADDLVIICGPRHKDIFAVRPEGKGRLAENALAWKMEARGSDSITPLFHKGILYFMNGQFGSAMAVKPKDGKVIWKDALNKGTACKASPLGVGDRIYNINENGEVFCIKAGKSFSLIEKKAFGGKLCRSSVTAVDNQLFIRTSDRLYCLED